MKTKTLMTVAILASTCSVAAARDKPEYDNLPDHAWYEAQKNQYGQFCCAESDAQPYYGDYTMNPDGSATLHTEHGDLEIEAKKVLKAPNLVGHPILWKLDKFVYCFMPGLGT